MKKILAVIVFILLISLFSGCLDDGPPTVDHVKRTREFIKDYIKNPETITFNNETVIDVGYNAEIYGSGTVMYEGNIRSFSYYIKAFYNRNINDFDYILKELIIGEV